VEAKPSTKLVGIKCTFRLKGGRDKIAHQEKELTLLYAGKAYEGLVTYQPNFGCFWQEASAAGCDQLAFWVVFAVPDKAQGQDLTLRGPAGDPIPLASLPELPAVEDLANVPRE
jgi:hypothetical protein